MTIETHVTERKALAYRISELLHQESTYAGVPSCAYKIGAVTIDRSGAIHTEDAEALEILKPFLIAQGYIDPEPGAKPNAIPEPKTDAEANTEPTSTPDAGTYAEPTNALDAEAAAEPDPSPTFGSGTSDIERMEISMPAEGVTATALKNLIFMLNSKQHLLNRAVGQEVFHISDGVIARLSEYTPESAEAFIELLDDFRALEELDGVDFRDGQVTLRFPFDAAKPEDWAIFGTLTAGIVKAAMGATRVSPKRLEPDNEKYYMHSWLIRLGFDGPEHKTLRKVLLRNLRGCSAFRSDAEAQRHREKYAEIRRASREGQVKAE